jgi:hypothetical protein
LDTFRSSNQTSSYLRLCVYRGCELGTVSRMLSIGRNAVFFFSLLCS